MSERNNEMRIAALIAAIFVCVYFLGAGALFCANIKALSLVKALLHLKKERIGKSQSNL